MIIINQHISHSLHRSSISLVIIWIYYSYLLYFFYRHLISIFKRFVLFRYFATIDFVYFFIPSFILFCFDIDVLRFFRSLNRSLMDLELLAIVAVLLIVLQVVDIVLLDGYRRRILFELDFLSIKLSVSNINL